MRTGIIDRLAGCFSDTRNQRFVEHSVPELLRQRINGLCLGYEDLNDHDRLRLDPLHALMAGKSDIEGNDRLMAEDRGKALAAHSTLNRLELGALGGDMRYKKIIAKPAKIEELLIVEAVKAIPRRVREIVLDFDATDDPLHGKQEGAYFHGYYRNYCYLPLYAFCGTVPLWTQLRDCKRDASDGTTHALEKIVPKIRERFGRQVRIIVRGDSAFAREQIMAWCEKEGIYYCFGLAGNKRLRPHLDSAFEQIEKELEEMQQVLPCRRFVDFTYSTLDSWSRKRRVVGKAEMMDKGKNPRFIVTNLPAGGFEGERRGRFLAQALYEKFYCARGDMENRIKEQQMDLFADRTSTHYMASNQLRLWFCAFAHLLFSRLCTEVLQGTELANASIGRIRLDLFKIATRIRISCRRILLEWPTAYPYQKLFETVYGRLAQLPIPSG